MILNYVNSMKNYPLIFILDFKEHYFHLEICMNSTFITVYIIKFFNSNISDLKIRE